MENRRQTAPTIYLNSCIGRPRYYLFEMVQGLEQTNMFFCLSVSGSANSFYQIEHISDFGRQKQLWAYLIWVGGGAVCGEEKEERVLRYVDCLFKS